MVLLQLEYLKLSSRLTLTIGTPNLKLLFSRPLYTLGINIMTFTNQTKYNIILFVPFRNKTLSKLEALYVNFVIKISAQSLLSYRRPALLRKLQTYSLSQIMKKVIHPRSVVVQMKTLEVHIVSKSHQKKKKELNFNSSYCYFAL